MGRLGLLVLICGLISAAQNAPTTQNAAPAKTAPTTSAAAKTAKAEPVAAKASEGITREQADAILNELRAIHQLLVAQGPRTPAAPASTSSNPPNIVSPPTIAPVPMMAPTPVTTDKVHLKVAADWHWMGRDDAPVTIVEFTDYQCPFCRKYHTETFAQLKKNYIDTGKVRFVSRDLPLDFHPNAQRAAEAAWCAGEQNKYWELRDTMITNSGNLSKEAIARYAQTNALDVAKFQACADAEKYKAEIQQGVADAGAVGITATPSFVIGKPAGDGIDGDRVVGALPESVFENEIQKFATAK
ncbi:MAG: thioredoxin domain-containing protein [Terriglobales bacterium]